MVTHMIIPYFDCIFMYLYSSNSMIASGSEAIIISGRLIPKRTLIHVNDPFYLCELSPGETSKFDATVELRQEAPGARARAPYAYTEISKSFS